MKTTLFFVYLAGVFFISWLGLYEPAKIVWFYLGAIPLFLYWTLKIYKQKDISINKTDYFYLIWLLILVVSSFINGNVLNSLTGTGYRHQGIIFFFILWIIGKTFRSIASPKQKNFLYGFIVAATIQAIFIIYQKLNQSILVGTLGEANAVAGALFPFLPYINNLFIFSLISLGALVTGSKIAIFVVVMVLLIKLPLKNNIKNFLGLILFLTTCFLIINNILSLSSESFFENRSTIWIYSMEAVTKKPFLGYGPEANEYLYDNLFAEDNLPLTFIIIDRAHNLFLDVAIWSGLAGLLFFAAWLLTSVQKIFKRKTQLISVLTILLYAFFQPLGVIHWILLFLMFNLQKPVFRYSWK